MVGNVYVKVHTFYVARFKITHASPSAEIGFGFGLGLGARTRKNISFVVYIECLPAKSIPQSI